MWFAYHHWLLDAVLAIASKVFICALQRLPKHSSGHIHRLVVLKTPCIIMYVTTSVLHNLFLTITS